MVYNGYYKVMSNIPKMGQLPTHDIPSGKLTVCYWKWLFSSLIYPWIENGEFPVRYVKVDQAG